MAQKRLKVGRKHKMICLVSASAIALLTPQAFAQGVDGQSAAIAFEQPAGPLGDTLLAINEAFGVSVIAAEDLVQDKTAPAIANVANANEALVIALSGSGLEAQQTQSGAIVIAEKAPAPASNPISEPEVEPIAPEREEEARIEDQIIVTGTKQNLGIQDTQASVSIVTDELIDEQAIFELADVFLRTANVTQTNGPFAFSIRGISSGGVGGAGTGRTANVYLDNAPASLNGLSSAFNLWDIEQVEVLRGPQSTTQGRNALAGAIVLQSADPEYEFGVKGRVLAGSDNTFQASGVITGPLVEDQVAVRLSADYREQDFETFNALANQAEGASDATTLRAKVLLEPKAVPSLRVELNAQYVDFFTSGDGSGVIRPDANSPDAIGFDPFDLINYDFRGGVVENENFRFLTDITYDFTDNWSGQLVA
ncbi:MAG: TonB-dependent receptor, partial [Pseudomonadota bacterium]